MISKDSDFLNNRLKQLKASVLSSRGSDYNGSIPIPQNNSGSHFGVNSHGEYDSGPQMDAQRSNSKQKYGITYTPLKQVAINTRVLSNSSSKVIHSGEIDFGRNHIEKVAKDQLTTNQKSTHETNENRRPVSLQPSELKKLRTNINVVQREGETLSGRNWMGDGTKLTRTVYSIGIENQNADPNFNRERNAGIVSQNERQRILDKAVSSSRVHISRVESGRDLSVNAERVHDDYAIQTTIHIGQPRGDCREITPRANLDVGSEVLKSLNQSSFLLRHEDQILADLNSKLLNEIDRNTRMHDDILSLRHSYELEQQKIADLDRQLRAELKHLQEKEREGLCRMESLEGHLSELTIGERETEDRTIRVKGELDAAKKEGDILRSELKRLAEVTGEKILDLENNLNAVTRMKELERENFEMERDKIANSGEFVIEQMRVHFNERTTRAEDQARGINAQREKLRSELRSIGDELRAFNQNADQRINNELSIAIQEETERHNKEMREIESKIRVEEDEIARANRRNQEMLIQLQNDERDGKNRLLASKNENIKYKEELSALESAFNKLLIQISSEGKDGDRRRENLEGLRLDLQDIKDKTANAEDAYAEEIEQLVSNCNSISKELEGAYNELLEQERKLIDKIKEQNSTIFDVQRRHAETIEVIQTSVNQTLNTQFKQLGSSRKIRPE